MQDHGMSFKPEMVRAILDDPPRKTQTRRIVTQHNSLIDGSGAGIRGHWPHLRLDEAWVDQGPSPAGNPGPYLKVPCYANGERLVHRVYPRIQVGDRIWVRESWKPTGLCWDMKPSKTYACGRFIYRADGEPDPTSGDYHGPWRPSIHMPKWAARTWLDVLEVRPERVREISPDDALAEGIDYPPHAITGPRYVFGQLWNSINAKRGFPFESNPWVWVVAFRRAQ